MLCGPFESNECTQFAMIEHETRGILGQCDPQFGTFGKLKLATGHLLRALTEFWVSVKMILGSMIAQVDFLAVF